MGKKTLTTIHFEDHGQDFLKWVINEKGHIVECTPAQGMIWTRWVVTDKKFKKGQRVNIINGTAKLQIKYPIEKVETNSNAKVKA